MRYAIVIVSLAITWLVAGRQLALFLDRFLTLRVMSLPVAPLQYDGGCLAIGALKMTLASTNNLRSDLKIHSDSANRVTLSAGGRSLPLGPRANPPDPPGRRDLTFVSEPGDELSFTSRQSLLGWPTPFEFSFLIPHSPWWKRYVYYRLIWKKTSGAKLEMFWRYEQRYYAAGGWTKPEMMWNSQTGLLWIDIRPEAPALTDAVVRYIARTKGWNRREYRMESRGLSADGHSDVMAVVFLEDERGCHPGAGKSVELYLDRASHEVIKEMGGQ